MIWYRSHLLIILLVIIWILCSILVFNNYKENATVIKRVLFTSESLHFDIKSPLPNSTCRHIRQSHTFCVDEIGYLCNYTDLLTSSCCPSGNFKQRFVCHSCKANHCCSVYEHCVSCCLNPNNKRLWNQVIKNTKANGRRYLLLSTDSFEFCSAVCRTSSLTVLHENQYRLF
ncbi:unnamed protein product [Heterobilharzia americana]|nr:unnamed protein product [Heterobilharzia americana]CAH8473388.1 unnamed protein product [Heterobilharzia americana]